MNNYLADIGFVTLGIVAVLLFSQQTPSITV
jgi:hypothetical protein